MPKALPLKIFLIVSLIHEVTASGSRAFELFPLPKGNFCCRSSCSHAGKNDSTTCCCSVVSAESRPALFLVGLASGGGVVLTLGMSRTY